MKWHHKGRPSKLNSSQIMLPSHLSIWPDIKSPATLKSASRARSIGKISASLDKKQTKTKTFPLARDGKDKSGEETECKIFSFSDDSDASTTDDSDEQSNYDSASEGILAKETRGSNLLQKSTRSDGISTDNEGENSDETDVEDDKVLLTTNIDDDQQVLDDGLDGNAKRLKKLTTLDAQNKDAGEQTRTERGSPGNVFNARSPRADVQIRADSKKLPFLDAEKRFKHYPDDASFTSPLNSESGDKPNLWTRSSKPSDQQSSALLLTKPGPHHPISVPVFSGLSFVSNKPSVAATEAQLQANLLRRGGHREFSSKAFSTLSEDENETISMKTPDSKIKKKRKDQASQDIANDPVDAEIAKQQAKYKEYLVRRKKENPELYQRSNVETNHEMTSDSALDVENHGERDTSRNTINQSKVLRTPNFPREGQRTHSSVLRTDDAENKNIVGPKKSKKRKRVTDKDQFSDDKKSRQSCNKSRKLNSVSEDRGVKCVELMHNNSTSVDPRSFSSQSANTYPLKQFAFPTQESVSRLTLNRPLTAHSNSAELRDAFKSLWRIMPKGLLRSTMDKLNRFHRTSLQSRLENCKEGIHSCPSTRVVTRIDENGDEIELLEENGTVIDPDPHTMSSDLTLLTAAKDLIALLSSKKVGLDLAAIVAGSTKPDRNLSGYKDKQSAQGPASKGLSPAAQSSRIAGGPEEETQKLREENRKLTAKIEKLKGRSI